MICVQCFAVTGLGRKRKQDFMETAPLAAFENARLAPKLHHPATFLERGVALPLTTPLLAGARARPSETKRLELIILNPSGGRGVYILPWAGIAAFCHPTVHDQVFNQRIAALPHVTPLIIRRVARQIALEGLAGEDAAVAAASAAETDKGELVLANYQLLMRLFQQMTADPMAARKLATGAGTDQAGRLRSAVEAAAAEVGRSADWTANALEQLADLMAGLGVGDGTKARIHRQITLLQETQAEIQAWSAARHDESLTEYGTTFSAVAGLTLSLAEGALAEARQLAADIVGLLQRWSVEPDGIRELAGRPEWLLDGWERICAIWRNAHDVPSQQLALADIAGLVPVMPKEVAHWSGTGQQLVDRDMSRHRRIVPFNRDWFTGESVFDVIARNESLRAAAC